jgi:hypothetical protein
MDNLYLKGYAAGARVIQMWMREQGWCRAKGMLKTRVRNMLKMRWAYKMPDAWSGGFEDAILDSYN